MYPGRLTGLLSTVTLPPDRRYLLCGSAELVVAVRDLLIEPGVPFTHVVAEIFF